MKIDLNWLIGKFGTNKISTIEAKDSSIAAKLKASDSNKDGCVQENELANVEIDCTCGNEESKTTQKTIDGGRTEQTYKDGRLVKEEFKNGAHIDYEDEGKTKMQYDAAGMAKKTYVNGELIREDYKDGSYAVYGQNGTRVLYDAKGNLIYGTQEIFENIDKMLPDCDKASKDNWLVNTWNTLFGKGKNQQAEKLFKEFQGLNDSELYLYHLQNGGKILSDLENINNSVSNQNLSKEFGEFIKSYKEIVVEFDNEYHGVDDDCNHEKSACSGASISGVVETANTAQATGAVETVETVEATEDYEQLVNDFNDLADEVDDVDYNPDIPSYDTELPTVDPIDYADDPVEVVVDNTDATIEKIKTSKTQLNEIISNPLISEDIKEKARTALKKLEKAESNAEALKSGAADVIALADEAISKAGAKIDGILTNVSTEIELVASSIGTSSPIIEAAILQSDPGVISAAYTQALETVELAQGTLDKAQQMLDQFPSESSILKFSEARGFMESYIANCEQNLREANKIKEKIEQAQTQVSEALEAETEEVIVDTEEQ